LAASNRPHQSDQSGPVLRRVDDYQSHQSVPPKGGTTETGRSGKWGLTSLETGEREDRDPHGSMVPGPFDQKLIRGNRYTAKFSQTNDRSPHPSEPIHAESPGNGLIR